MCGIAGVYGYTDEALLQSMLSQIVHRGPDDEGRYINTDDGVMMGTRRLSIVDLEGGSQPMSNEDGTVTVAFNGEIYNHEKIRRTLTGNHQFRTECDTEVLVHLWEEYGTEMVEHVEGMFAFSIWDESREQLFLARDRLGIKPLYYTTAGNGIAWGSEIPSLLETGIDREIDQKAVYNHFRLGYTPWPQTLLQTVRKVPPGTSFLITEDGISSRRYWDLPTVPSRGTVPSFQAAADRVQDLLRSSVENRLMADVPVGAFLSGGLDSSSVVGLASEVTDNQLKTFSISFLDEEFDESSEARYVADHYGTDHHEITVDLTSMDVFGDLIESLGEPIGDLPLLPIYALSEYASDEVKVVLTGEGADELFAGYDRYRSIPARRKKVANLPPFAHDVAGAVGDITPVGSKYFNYLSGLKDDEEIIFNQTIDFGSKLGPYEYLEIDENGGSSGLRDKISEATANVTSEDAIQSMSAFDITHMLPDDVLYKTDHTSMAASLEARVPFLDYELVDYVFQLPPEYKANPEDVKLVLKKAMADILPEKILTRQKFGMGIPADRWFRTDNEAIARWFTEPKLNNTPYVSTELVFEIWNDHRNHQRDAGRSLWNVLNYVAWYHKFIHPETAVM
ncbi:asparagine synthase (glutamine-hydrolyzing) [Halorubrum ezzemoulense]|uniref:Putative asparagine synthetase [glutamine-hydrolyzing] n=1 Tax=Halorubrum ezzemoulense TaxID=337243 RepID=A0A256JLF6_HALEZ|nr:asparagine synthase (glutamine-hydrolyzing) [Halorubrum ezzemoulense]OYR69600.1 asparagine synthase (glutamine-hydrolyzing) [Halorubrum ezzemoulense]